MGTTNTVTVPRRGPWPWVPGRARGWAVGLLACVTAVVISGCDPAPGEIVNRYLVENRCEVPIRADANGVGGVERIPVVRDQPLIGPGETALMYNSFVQVERIYVSVSRDGAQETEHIYPFPLAEMTPVPTDRSNVVAYTFVIEGDMCPTP